MGIRRGILSPHSKKLRRLNFLMKMIEVGKCADEAHKILAKKEKGARLRRGSVSERNVQEALSRLSIVSNVKRSRRGSHEDDEGKDLTIYLRGHEIDEVFVQIKSSHEGICNFKAKTSRRLKLPRNTFDTWLREQKMIVLNGRDSPDEIRAKFLNQLDSVVQFHKVKPRHNEEAA